MTKIYPKEKDKSNWKRMLNNSNNFWESNNKPDGRLTKKGWHFEIPVEYALTFFKKEETNFEQVNDTIYIL